MEIGVIVAIVFGLLIMNAPLIIKLIGSDSSTFKTNAIELASSLIEDSVVYMNQTVVNKQKVEGVFTEQAKEQAFNECKTIVLNTMSTSLTKALSTILDDVDIWVEVQIEKYVDKAKVK